MGVILLEGEKNRHYYFLFSSEWQKGKKQLQNHRVHEFPEGATF